MTAHLPLAILALRSGSDASQEGRRASRLRVRVAVVDLAPIIGGRGRHTRGIAREMEEGL